MELFQRMYQSISPRLYSVDSKKIVDSIQKTVSKAKPLNKDNILYYYLPIQGCCCYTALSVNVTNPMLMMRLFPRRDLTNTLLLGATCGAGLWLWSRPHMAATYPTRRFFWSFLGSSLWSFGSILLWAIIKNSVGKKPAVGTILGLTTGAFITFTAIDYFNYLELMFCGAIPVSSSVLYDGQSDMEDEKYDLDL